MRPGKHGGVFLCCLSLWGGVQAAPQMGASVLLQVPFFPDKTDQCGPATLAGMLNFWGKQTDPKELRGEMYSDQLKGTLPMDLVSTAEKRGLEVTMVAGQIPQIQEELRAGRPVLAMLNRGYTIMPIDHYVLVTGYDEDRAGFFMHSGGKANQFISYRKFENQWKKTDHWAMFAKSAGR
jgi:ABC-type bacteriocin/lantibiotic exporter with double-glycine peptidase domain